MLSPTQSSSGWEGAKSRCTRSGSAVNGSPIVDYAMLVKIYGSDAPGHKYSPVVRVRAVALQPAFYTRIYSLRYGKDAIEVYHDRSECRIGRLIVRDGNQELGTDGRRRCEECRKYGPA